MEEEIQSKTVVKENDIKKRVHKSININYKSFWSMLALMFGFTIFSASIMSGSNLADGMPIWMGIISIIVGNLFLAIYGGVNAYISNKFNKNLDGVLKEAFGEKGAFVPSMVMIITQIGWFAVGIAMIAKPIAASLQINPYILVFPIAIAIISTAFFGIKSLTKLSIIAVPLVIILGITTISIAGASNNIIEASSIKLGVWAGISLVIATFISGATFVPNFSVNANNTKNAVITTSLAFFLGNGLMITFGFVGGLLYENTVFDFVSIAKKQGFMIVGLIILILNIWTTNDSGLYSISLGFENWLKISKKVNVIIFGLIGAAFSMWMFDNFIWFLAMLNSFVPAIGALIMTSFIFKNKKEIFSKYNINFMQIGIWIVASFLTFIPEVKSFAPLVSFGVAFVGGFIFELIKKCFVTNLNTPKSKGRIK